MHWIYIYPPSTRMPVTTRMIRFFRIWEIMGKSLQMIPSRELTYPPDKAYLKMIFLSPGGICYTEGLKDRRNYTNFSNRRCKFSISPTRCSDRRYSCCKSSASRGFKRFLKTDLMTIFYSSPRKNCKKPREKSIFYSLSIRGVAEVALNQCS